MSDNALPTPLAELITDFQELGEKDRLQLLLELSDELPDLPERFADHPELLEPVPECQSPLFLIAELDVSGDDAQVRLHFSAPAEAPTTRGFARSSEEHTYELQSRGHLVCRLLLEKKKKKIT